MKEGRLAAKIRARKVRMSYSQMFLRVVIGALFFVSGILDIIKPSSLTNAISGFGIPAAVFFAWLLILLETIFGLAVLLGWNVRYSVWPLMFVILLSTLSLIAVAVQTGSFWPVFGSFWFNLLEIAILVKVYSAGAGAWAIGRN
jgi:uncharacterized membrane protein YphA (DoxX/SURF4 family)